MQRLLVRAAAAVLVGLLVACEGLGDPPTLSFTMLPSGTLGYEVSSSGEITITTRNLVFRNPAGAPGLTLTAYRIEFFDENDLPAPVGDNAQDGSLSIFVPPGIQCASPDPQLGCNPLSEGARFAPGVQVVTESNYQLLPVGVAQEHLFRSFPDFGGDDDLFLLEPQPVGWHAEITFSGRTATGGFYTSPTYRLGIAPPN
jgi:hypothetical protein